MDRECVHNVPVGEMCAPCAEFGFEEKTMVKNVVCLNCRQFVGDDGCCGSCGTVQKPVQANMDRFVVNSCMHALETDCIYCKPVDVRCDKCGCRVYEAMYETGMQRYCSCQCDLNADFEMVRWRKTVCVCDCIGCKWDGDCQRCELNVLGYMPGELCNE